MKTGLFKGKPVKVVITGNALKEFEKLSKVVSNEKARGILSSCSQTLLNAINHKITLLKENPQRGIQIPKNQIPLEYLLLYEINNLWKLNLPGAWRIIYTINGTEIKIVSLILDIFSHKKYEKRFGYS